MRRLVFIGDLHIGSHAAPWPKGMKTDKGAEFIPSEQQLKLNEYWDEFWAGRAKTADTVYFLGDICQGNNRKEWGQGTITPNLHHQIDAAVEFIWRKVKGKQIRGVSGSKYHDSLDTSLDRRVIEDLNGEFLGALANRRVAGKNIQITHSLGAPPKYPGTFLSQTSQVLDEGIGRGDITHSIDIWVCGHYHQFNSLRVDNRLLIMNPGWQLWFEWAPMTRYYGNKKHKLGATVVDIKDNGEVNLYPYQYKTISAGDDLQKENNRVG